MELKWAGKTRPHEMFCAYSHPVTRFSGKAKALPYVGGHTVIGEKEQGGPGAFSPVPKKSLPQD